MYHPRSVLLQPRRAIDYRCPCHRLSWPCVLILMLATGGIGYYLGELREARKLNAAMEAAFALPLPTPEPTPGPLPEAAGMTL